jgi:tetratricopeptide (TPR) repeat protein
MAMDATNGPRTKAGAAFELKTFDSGRFVVQRLLGEGGQKTVYLARDTELDRDVAIAVIKTQGLDAAGLVRVRREAQTLAGLGAQPHVVTMYDIGQEPASEGPPVPYFVCEYMAGGDLERELRLAGGPLPLERVLAIGQDLCRALEVAHGRGILHRDIKPGNIWLTEEGHAKLGDFGLAVAFGLSRITQSGTIMGTASYMPPEQAMGSDVDVQGDLYALGCVLYEMVTGRPPFLGDDTIAVISQHINTAPVAASWHRADLPRALDALIERLLEKAPEERPQSATEVLELLAAIAAAPASADAAVLGDANSLDRLAGGVFVGREGETQQIRSALDRALSGQGNLILLAGEPGIGKTRLAEELTTYARLRGAQALWGRCYEGEGAPAYWPWVQAIRSYVHERDAEALRSELGSGAADIAQVVSEVRERLPDVPPPPSMEPEQARFRLFDSVTTFLKNAANAQPLVFILDDLHWADKPSLLLLQFVARGLGGTRLLVVGTYRDVEVRRQHPLSSTLAELAREQLSQRIVMRGLSDGEVARFIEMSCGVTPPEGLVAAVCKDTEGNPFFVKEVVNLLAREGRLDKKEPTTSWTVAIPQSVREVVGRRLDDLSEECNRVLPIAAVIGRQFDLRTLEQITGLPDDRVLDLLEESVAARIIDEVKDAVGRYSFSHGLIRETLYEELTGTRRARLHRQIGEALEQAYVSRVEPHLAELAYHFCEAAQGGDDVDKAVDYASRAGERALSLLAYEQAAVHYERALQALQMKEPADESRQCDLLLGLSQAQTRAGEPAMARDACRQAARIARTLGAAEQFARAAQGFSEVWTPGGVFPEEEIELLEEALTVLGSADSAFRARLLALLASQLYFTPSRERGIGLSQDAVAIARRVGDPPTLGYVLERRRYVLMGPDGLEKRLAAVDELLGLAERTGSNELRLQGHIWRVPELLQLGDLRATEQEFEAANQVIEQLRQVPQYRWFEAVFHTMRAALEGRFEEAEPLAQQALAIGQGVQDETALQVFGTQLFVLRWQQGRLHDLEPVFKGFVERYPAILAFRCALAFLYSELGQREQAQSEFEVLAASDFADLPRDGAWLIGMMLLSQACAFLGDTPRAATLHELLLPFARRNIVAAELAACVGSASRYLGTLASTMGQWDEATRHFQDALEMNGRLGARPLVAHTQYDYARMLLSRGAPGDGERALELLRLALDTAQELGMKKVIDDCLALKAQAQAIEPPRP